MIAPRPTKIIGTHLNFRSRASQRGTLPDVPSYFFKPPSSLAADGDPVVRPQGTELLTFEGEVAIVIARPARGLTPDRGLQYVGWIAPANDFGLHDLRWVERGSNVFAKGQDGFTPIGSYVPVVDVDVSSLMLQTRVNGEVLQEDSTSDLIFPFGFLVADLSRFMTLEPGDVILSGTPAGSRPVEPGDVVEVDIEGVGTVRNSIVEAVESFPEFGAQPFVSADVRAAAYGVRSGGG